MKNMATKLLTRAKSELLTSDHYRGINIAGHICNEINSWGSHETLIREK